MPKLPEDRAEGAEKQDATGPKPIKGKYVVRLTEVEEGETGPNSKNPGTDKWVWKFAVAKEFHPELRTGRHQTTFFEHVPLTESMDWKIKQLFAALGYEVNSNTDEIIEDEDAFAVAYVRVGKDQSNADRSEVTRYVPFDPAKYEKVPEDDAAEDDDNQ
jgi:hypothetical protein